MFLVAVVGISDLFFRALMIYPISAMHLLAWLESFIDLKEMLDLI